MTRGTKLTRTAALVFACLVAADGSSIPEVRAEMAGEQAAANTEGQANKPATTRRVFSIVEPPIRVPDGTLVYPFLNSNDSTSGLPSGVTEGFSLAAGVIEPHVRSKIHVMPLVTQVTFVLSGSLDVRMKEFGGAGPYTLHLGPNQAVITRPATFFQLINSTGEPTRVLYIVSPPYLFLMGADGTPVYDDSVVLSQDWSELERQGWQPPALLEHRITEETRRDARERRNRITGEQ